MTCPFCRHDAPLDEWTLAIVGIEGRSMVEDQGRVCPACRRLVSYVWLDGQVEFRATDWYCPTPRDWHDRVAPRFAHLRDQPRRNAGELAV